MTFIRRWRPSRRTKQPAPTEQYGVMAGEREEAQHRSVTEADILRVLGGLAAASHVYQRQLEDARPFLEVLCEDYTPAWTLIESLTVAQANPSYLGTPRHLEQFTVAVLRELRGDIR